MNVYQVDVQGGSVGVLLVAAPSLEQAARIADQVAPKDPANGRAKLSIPRLLAVRCDGIPRCIASHVCSVEPSPA